jgi:hypothetical protein
MIIFIGCLLTEVVLPTIPGFFRPPRCIWPFAHKEAKGAIQLTKTARAGAARTCPQGKHRRNGFDFSFDNRQIRPLASSGIHFFNPLLPGRRDRNGQSHAQANFILLTVSITYRQSAPKRQHPHANVKSGEPFVSPLANANKLFRGKCCTKLVTDSGGN